MRDRTDLELTATPPSRQRNLTNFKIAGITLVGIVAILTLLGIPNWIYEMVRQGPVERTIYSLTPDLVISRCGTPISDNTEKTSPTALGYFVFREMSYKGGKESVVLSFARADQGTTQGRWVLNSMHDSVDHSRYATGKSKLTTLPCLAGS